MKQKFKKALLASALLSAFAVQAQSLPAGSIGSVQGNTANQFSNYTFNFTPTTTGANYIGFAFRQDPAYWTFGSVGLTTGGGSNLLTNGNLANGGPVQVTTNSGTQTIQAPANWGVWYQAGTYPAAAGTWSAGQWYDGAVGSFDGIYQGVALTAGTLYTITFRAMSNNAVDNNAIQLGVYAGACSSVGGLAAACVPNTPSFAPIATPGQTINAGNPSAPPVPVTPVTPPGPTLVNDMSTGTTGSDVLGTTPSFNGGTLQIVADGATLNQLFGITTAGGTIDQNGLNATFTGVISGTGNLTITNTATGGSITLTAQNTYTGTTTVNAGATLINNGSIASSSVLTNLGTFTNNGTAGNFVNGFNGDGNTAVTNNNGTMGNGTNYSTFNNNTGAQVGTVSNVGTFNNAGTTGDVQNSGTFNNNGTVASVSYNNSTINNHGTVTGDVNNGGHFNNYSDGTVGGTVTSTQDTSVSNSGIINTVVLQSNAILTNDGTVTTVSTDTGTTVNNLVGGTITNGFTNAGTLTNAGTVSDIVNNGTFGNTGRAGAVTNNGAFDNALGGTIASLTNTTTATNEGNITGAVNNLGTFTNSGTTGAVTNSGATTNTGTTGAVTNSGTFTNSGTTGAVTNSNTFNNSGSVGTVANTGTFNQTGGSSTLINNAGTGTVNLSGGTASINNLGVVTQSGGTASTVTNAGTYTVTGGSLGSVNNSGLFNITSASNPLNLSSYTQTRTGSTVLNSGERVVVSGVANVNGNLTVLNVPRTYGQRTYLTANSVTGKYSTLTVNPDLAPLGYGLVYTGNTVSLKVTPSSAYTLAAVNTTTGNIANVSNLQAGSLGGTLNYDCNLFGEEGICVSTGVRTTSDSAGSIKGGNFIIGKRIDDNWRAGIFVDQAFGNTTVGNVKLATNPAMGLFANWNEDARGYGWGIQTSAAVSTGNLDINRAGTSYSESTTGKTTSNGQALQVKTTYTMPVTSRDTVTPYAGLRYTSIKNNGYTEQGAVFPITYGTITQSTTDALAGIGLSHNFGRITGSVSAGVIQNLSYSAGTLTGTSGIYGAENINTKLPGSGYTSLSLGTGISYDLVKNQYIGASVGWQQKSLLNTSILSGAVTYTVGF